MSVSAQGLRLSVPGKVLLADGALALPAGRLGVLTGPSGAGKSTLLAALAGLARPDAGVVSLAAHALPASDRGRTMLRRRVVGVMFQSHHLLLTETVRANLGLAIAVLPRRTREAAWQRAAHTLEELGLPDAWPTVVGALSGGERQRVALCRAVAHDPAVLFCDEPTASLDERTAADLITLLRGQAAAGRTVLCVSHDPALAAAADTVWHMADGALSVVVSKEAA